MNDKNQVNKEGIIKTRIEVISKKDFINLEKLWLELEERSTPSFFLSWLWISTWLEQVESKHKLVLVTASIDCAIVGLGVFVERTTKRYGLLKARQWYLHRSGEAQLDQIWIENNDFLIQCDNQHEISEAIWSNLGKRDSEVEEIIVTLTNTSNALHAKKTLGNYQCFLSQRDFGYKVLTHRYRTLDDYLSSLSKNTRNQIKRGIRHIRENSNMLFSMESSPEKQLDLLEKTKLWHIEKWAGTETPSGFTNRNFLEFHQALIKSSHPTSKTLMGKLIIDKEVVGCLYCLAQKSEVFFYLSCIKPVTDNKTKLGLIMHTLMIEHLIIHNRNYSEYNFLAGDARYKKSLSQEKEEFFQITLQKKLLKFALERKLRNLKRHLKKYI